MNTSKRTFDNLKFIALFAIIFSLQSCEKHDRTVLPEISSSGGFHFGMLVDGKVWVPKSQLHNGYFNSEGGGVKASRFRSNGSPDTAYIIIKASIAELEQFEDIDMSFALDPQTLEVISSVNQFYRVFTRVDPDGEDIDYFTSKEPADYMSIIELNGDEKFISGTFDLGPVVSEAGDTIFLTEGRFDLNYGN